MAEKVTTENPKKGGYTYTQTYSVSDTCMELICNATIHFVDACAGLAGKVIDLEHARQQARNEKHYMPDEELEAFKREILQDVSRLINESTSAPK